MARDRALAAALADYESGRYREALAQFEALVAESPEPGEACLWAGMAARRLGEHDDAADHLFLAVHHLPRDDRAWLALGESLVDAGRADEALEPLREAESLSVDPVPALRAQARALKVLGRHEEAIARLERVVRARPGDALERSVLALALLRAGRLDEAHAESERSLALDAHGAEACHHAGLVERERGQIPRAAALFQRALDSRPESPEVRSALGHALRDLGRIEEALSHYDAVLAQHPAFPDAALNRAQLLLMCGRYAEGWDAYECRFAFADGPRPPPALAAWTGKGGEPVLVYGEQGIGDQVMFASCIPDLQASASAVSILCHPRLVPLFRRSFAGATVEAQSEASMSAGGRQSAVSIASLPRHFRRAPESFGARPAYLRADAVRADQWRARFDDGSASRRIGISWRGGSARTRGHLRSVPAAAFASLGAAAGVRWFSLQYGDASADAATMTRAGMPVARWPGIEGDLDDCAAAIEAVDLVITIDNTIAHLAGAMGKEAWILVPAGAEWRYGMAQASMPWYPRARLFRQADGEGWEPVLRKVSSALAMPATTGPQP